VGAPFLFDLLNRFMVVRSSFKPWIGPEEMAGPASIAEVPPPAVAAAKFE
jgi:hypothetical protein